VPFCIVIRPNVIPQCHSVKYHSAKFHSVNCHSDVSSFVQVSFWSVLFLLSVILLSVILVIVEAFQQRPSFPFVLAPKFDLKFSGTALIVEWKNVYLQTRDPSQKTILEGPFTFQVRNFSFTREPLLNGLSTVDLLVLTCLDMLILII
jgi:hypothetical protein